MELYVCVTDCAWICWCANICVFVYYVVRYNSIELLIWIDSLQLIHVSVDTFTCLEMVWAHIESFKKKLLCFIDLEIICIKQKIEQKKGIKEMSIPKMQISRNRI